MKKYISISNAKVGLECIRNCEHFIMQKNGYIYKLDIYT